MCQIRIVNGGGRADARLAWAGRARAQRRLALLLASSQYKSHVSLPYIPDPSVHDFYDPSPCTSTTSLSPPQSYLVVITGLLPTMGYLGFIWPFTSVRPPHLLWPAGVSGSMSGRKMNALVWLPYPVSPLILFPC